MTAHVPPPTPTLLSRLGPAVADYPAGAVFGPRDAGSYEFVWLLHGSARWVCGDLTVPLTPGTLLLVRPGMRDMFHWDGHRPTRHAYTHFRLPAAAGGTEPLDDTGWPVVRDLTGRSDPTAALCRYLLTLGATRPPDWERHAEETLRLLLLTFVDGTGTGPPALPEPLLAMMAAVRGHWSDGVARPLPLERLARAAGVSASTLSRICRRHLGVSPVAGLERLRLARAEPLLWLSNLSLRAIAVRCGFPDAYHFSRRFRAVYGMSPSAFRKLPPESAPPSPVAAGALSALQALAPPSPADPPGA
ncbi:MAG: AraC family transcriptional regulator [Streptomyces sp.]|uniref:helix-turn-helix transcriptional regulator n=1 Tax=Streptomyces sp. TaxID=1931 RepID=UPI0025DA1F42|nr:AraC family transcriptional regulator [Streptomyces sp.]MBW8794452.1 AraC family transcriptional regulator [Streptomyces sp.]